MAEIYTKNAEKTLILEPRESMLRAFDFGAWTELRMGMYFGGVAASGNDAQGLGETVTIASALDRIAWGIKDSGAAVPGQATSNFLGMLSETRSSTAITGSNSGSFRSATGSDGSSSRALVAGGFHDAVLVNGVGGTDSLIELAYPAPTGSTGYASFAAMKLLISNLGLSTQTVSISAALTSSVAGNAYNLTNLRSAINGATYGTPRVLTWNDGTTARPIPACWYLRLPFLSNRIRVSAIQMLKIA